MDPVGQPSALVVFELVPVVVAAAEVTSPPLVLVAAVTGLPALVLAAAALPPVPAVAPVVLLVAPLAGPALPVAPLLLLVGGLPVLPPPQAPRPSNPRATPLSRAMFRWRSVAVAVGDM